MFNVPSAVVQALTSWSSPSPCSFGTLVADGTRGLRRRTFEIDSAVNLQGDESAALVDFFA